MPKKKTAKKTTGSKLEDQRREVLTLVDFTIDRLRKELLEAYTDENRKSTARIIDIENSIDKLFESKELIRSNVRVESVLERLARNIAPSARSFAGKG